VRRTLYLVHDQAKATVCTLARSPEYDGWKVTFLPPVKTRPQEEMAHAMIGDIAGQMRLHGRCWDRETWKRLVIDQFRRDTDKDPDLGPLWESMGTMEVMPSLDGAGLVSIGWQSRNFPRKLYSALIEWLMAFGAENDIVWAPERGLPR
jgi:hypothetical protein